MKRSRKILVLLLAAVMILSLAACGESGGTTASGEPTGAGTDGNTETVSTEPSEEPTEEPGDINWNFENGVLTISGKGAMQNYDRYWDVYPEWGEHEDEIVSVVVEKGVTHIGDDAFSSCQNLISADIASSVKSIGESAFRYTALVKITGGDGVESVDYKAFDSVPWLKTEEFAILGDVLLKYNGADAFVTIPSDVKVICSEAFRVCDFISTVEIPKGVTEIGYSAFSGCTSLVMADIPDSVKTIGANAFRDCTSLVSVEIPKSVKTIGENAFESCTSLISATIADGVETIGNYAFWGCDITTIEIPKSVTAIGIKAFPCAGIYVDDGNSSYCDDGGILFTKDKSVLVCYPNAIRNSSYTIPSSVTTIGTRAFFDCDFLAEIVIPESVTTIGVGAFWDCSYLTEVVIPSSVTTIEESAFKRCSSLAEIAIPEGTTSIGEGAFYECSSLTRIVIPESVTNFGQIAFGFTAVTAVEISPSFEVNWDSEGQPFAGCDITDVYFTGSETEWTEGRYSNLSDSDITPTIHYNSSMPE